MTDRRRRRPREGISARHIPERSPQIFRPPEPDAESSITRMGLTSEPPSPDDSVQNSGLTHLNHPRPEHRRFLDHRGLGVIAMDDLRYDVLGDPG